MKSAENRSITSEVSIETWLWQRREMSRQKNLASLVWLSNIHRIFQSMCFLDGKSSQPRP
jgi:hypothetical protein